MIAKRLRNRDEFVAKKHIELDKQELMNCLPSKERLKFRNYRTK